MTLHFLYTQGADCIKLCPAISDFPRKTRTHGVGRGTARPRSSPPDGARCTAEGSRAGSGAGGRAGSRPLGQGTNSHGGPEPPSRAAPGRCSPRHAYTGPGRLSAGRTAAGDRVFQEVGDRRCRERSPLPVFPCGWDALPDPARRLTTALPSGGSAGAQSH